MAIPKLLSVREFREDNFATVTHSIRLGLVHDVSFTWSSFWICLVSIRQWVEVVDVVSIRPSWQTYPIRGRYSIIRDRRPAGRKLTTRPCRVPSRTNWRAWEQECAPGGPSEAQLTKRGATMQFAGPLGAEAHLRGAVRPASTLGSHWGHFGVTSGSLWDHLGVTLG